MIEASANDLLSDYRDCVQRTLAAEQAPQIPANAMLALLLQGCIQAHPWQVLLAMRLRNAMVKPWRLRTSNIGCPVSSLLDREATMHFAGAYPVRRIVRDDASRAEIVLGADDRHLCFRTSISAERLDDGGMHVTLTTAVQISKRFGRIYMAVVHPIHRRWIAPVILDAALEYACSASAKTKLEARIRSSSVDMRMYGTCGCRPFGILVSG